jgi:phage terminase large subunit
MNITIKKRVFNDKYYPLLWDNSRYLHFYGSAGSGKSVFVAQKLVLESFKRKQNQDVLVIRKIEKTVKESVYKLIKSIIYQWKLQDHFDFFKSPSEIINKVTGSKFVFSGLDDPEKVKSIAGIQKIWIEEATELNRDDYLELDRRLRGMKDHQIIFSYNPIDENHWLKKLFHNSQVDNCKILKTTYLDNKFVDEDYAKVLNSLKEVDENQWRIYALGEWGVANLAHKFDAKKLMQIQPKQPLQIIDGVKIFTMPEPKQIYVMGIDPSSGLGGDFTAISVRNFYTGQLVAQMKSKATELETAKIAVNLANFLETQRSKCYIACEVNGLGRAVQTKIQESWPSEKIYKKYIQDPTKQFDTLVPDYGWETTSKNRDLIINEFANAFALDQIEVVNEDEIEEMRNFIWKTDKNDARKGRYEAQENSNDDLLFADMICLAAFDFVRQYG